MTTPDVHADQFLFLCRVDESMGWKAREQVRERWVCYAAGAGVAVCLGAFVASLVWALS